MKLRNNLLIGELVEAFREARPKVLDHARISAVSIEARSPKRKHAEGLLDEPDSSPQRKRTRSSGRTQAQQQRQSVVVDSENDDEDFIPGKGAMKEWSSAGIQTDFSI